MAEEKKQKNNKGFIFAVGRRRGAVARVRLYSKISGSLKFGEVEIKKGDIVVNDRSVADYFKGEIAKAKYELPLKLTNNLGKFAVIVKAEGGGLSGQLDATVLGISRALSSIDASFRPTLKKRGLLTRDQRVRERRKVGTGGKARRKKQSPKR
ncbi:MAG: 30S ribosomal protein S9 [Patescibacteria group bacterium]|mgnify:CR=1 FL=1